MTALALGWGPPASAQQAEPCVYTDAGGAVVITDDPADTRCSRPEPAAPTFRAPGRLRMSLHVAEMISLTHSTAARYRVDHRLVESLVEMESGFDPRAVSRAGALGLMQLMPPVAASYGVTDPFDPWQNLDAGVRHLRQLLLHFNGDLTHALAAYNAGIGAVERHDGVPPYRETQEYVRRVLYRYRQRVEGTPFH